MEIIWQNWKKNMFSLSFLKKMDEAFLTVEYFLKEFKVCGQGHKEKK